jgi:hypothetical protein
MVTCEIAVDEVDDRSIKYEDSVLSLRLSSSSESRIINSGTMEEVSIISSVKK